MDNQLGGRGNASPARLADGGDGCPDQDSQWRSWPLEEEGGCWQGNYPLSLITWSSGCWALVHSQVFAKLTALSRREGEGEESLDLTDHLRESNSGSWPVVEAAVRPLCRAHICHNYHKLYLWRKFGKMWEILENFEKFWEILPQFTRFHVEKNWAQKVNLWRKNDKYEVCM